MSPKFKKNARPEKCPFDLCQCPPVPYPKFKKNARLEKFTSVLCSNSEYDIVIKFLQLSSRVSKEKLKLKKILLHFLKKVSLNY